jgi:hypothetical protein
MCRMKNELPHAQGGPAEAVIRHAEVGPADFGT